MSKELGTENFDNLVLSLTGITVQYDRAMEDGKVTKMEAIGIGITLLSKAGQLLPVFKEIGLEILDLSKAEKENHLNKIKNDLVLRNEKTEAYVEGAYEVVLTVLNVRKKIKEIINGSNDNGIAVDPAQ